MLEFKEKKPKKPHPDLLRQRRAVSEGRGIGHGAAYRPFIQIKRNDFKSKGLSQTLPNPFIGRDHHLLSKTEYAVALYLMHLGVPELREQYPMRLEDDDDEFARGWEHSVGTLSLAKRMGIRHPIITREEPRIQTTDILVTDVHGRHHPVFVRPVEDLPAPGSRQADLLELHRLYWAERGAFLSIKTELDVSAATVALLVWALDGVRHEQGAATPEFLQFLHCYNGYEPLIEVMSQWHEGARTGLLRFKAAIFTGQVTVRMNHRNPPSLNQAWGFQTHGLETNAVRLNRFLLQRETSHA